MSTGHTRSKRVAAAEMPDVASKSRRIAGHVDQPRGPPRFKHFENFLLKTFLGRINEKRGALRRGGRKRGNEMALHVP